MFEHAVRSIIERIGPQIKDLNGFVKVCTGRRCADWDARARVLRSEIKLYNTKGNVFSCGTEHSSGFVFKPGGARGR